MACLLQPGVKTRVPAFGSTEALEELDPTVGSSTAAFLNMVNTLVGVGYEKNKTLRGGTLQPAAAIHCTCYTLHMLYTAAAIHCTCDTLHMLYTVLSAAELHEFAGIGEIDAALCRCSVRLPLHPRQ